MRITVTCEVCGGRQKLERSVDRPQLINCICIVCETVLTVRVSRESFREPEAPKARA